MDRVRSFADAVELGGLIMGLGVGDVRGIFIGAVVDGRLALRFCLEVSS